jgi:hypothetical protein
MQMMQCHIHVWRILVACVFPDLVHMCRKQVYIRIGAFLSFPAKIFGAFLPLCFTLPKFPDISSNLWSATSKLHYVRMSRATCLLRSMDDAYLDNVGKVNMELDATITVLLISKISSTCFGQTFAHLQERKNETFTTYSTMSCDVVGRVSGRVAWHYVYVCVTVFRNMLSWSWRSIKLLLLHLVGVPYLLYQH